MILRGMAHVHSYWSYDGCHALDAIVCHARERRLDFVLMSEHNRTLTDEDMASFVTACDALTRETGVLVVPGIECEATPDHVHVLAYGTRCLVRDRQVDAIAAKVRAAGGLAVLAHPMYRDAWTCVGPDHLAALDGWEVWNGKADGRWYPSSPAIERLGALRRAGIDLAPMAGSDLHRLTADPGIVLELTCEARDEASVLGAIARRAYAAHGRAWHFEACDALRPPAPGLVHLAAGGLLRVRAAAKAAHAWLVRHGVRAPAMLRRVAWRFLG